MTTDRYGNTLQVGDTVENVHSMRTRGTVVRIDPGCNAVVYVELPNGITTVLSARLDTERIDSCQTN